MIPGLCPFLVGQHYTQIAAPVRNPPTGPGLEVEKLDPGTAAFAALLAPGITAYAGSSAWMTRGGADGLSLRHGDGPPDDEEDGEDGEFYIDVAPWDIYGPKGAGAWGAGTALIGPPGQPGDDGPAGSQILKGAGAPGSGLGSDSDWYFDTTAKAFYGPKTAGVWVRRQASPGTRANRETMETTGRMVATLSSARPRRISSGGWPATSSGQSLSRLPTSPVQPATTAIRVSQAPRAMMAACAPGSQFHSGAGAPSSGLGANGDWYFDTAAKAVHGKSGGTWGSGVSVKGDAGDDGVNGATMHYGSDAPLSGLGADGDAYIDEKIMAFYGPKAAGSWPVEKPLRPPVSVVSSLPGSPDASTFYVING